MLIIPPILGYRDMNGRLTLDTDTRNIGITGILLQIHDGQERIIEIVSNHSFTR